MPIERVEGRDDPVEIVARAPGRVNLIGDHTDHQGGLALPMAIDRWTEVRGRRVRGALRLRSDALVGTVDVRLPSPTALDRIEPAWGRYAVAVAHEVGHQCGRSDVGFTGTVSTTLPVGAGLSSSASLELALALALGADPEPDALAELGRRAEHAATGLPTGIMDQRCLAWARAGHATLVDCTSGETTAVRLPAGFRVVVRHVEHRTLVGSGYADRVADCARAARDVGPLRDASVDDLDSIGDPVARRRARHVVSENRRVRDAVAALASGDLGTLGALVTESHASLRDDFEVSTPALDAAVDALIATPGVFGARLTGGGFGGCVVAVCAPDAEVDGWTVRAVDGARLLAG